MQPGPQRQWFVGAAQTHIAPQLGFVPAVYHQHVEHAVTIEVNQQPATATPVTGYTGLLADLGEAPVGLLQQQVVGVQHGEVGHGRHVSLDDEKVGQAIVVDIGKLRVPGGGRVDVAPHIGPVCRDAAFVGYVAVAGLAAVAVEFLQLVVRHAGQEHFGAPITVEIVAGNTHAPDLQWLPALFGGVQGRRLPGGDFPQLFLSALVELAVVADPQARLTVAAPVRKQHRQGAVAGNKLGRRSKFLATRRWSQQAAWRATTPGELGFAAVYVGSDGEGRPFLVTFPGGGESAVQQIAAL